MIWLGVDPGKSGGIARVWRGDLTNQPVGPGTVHAQAWNMPETERDLWRLIESLAHEKNSGRDVHALIERVHAMPKQGVSSCFTFGRVYGSARMALIGNMVPFEEVNPRAWQAKLGCLTHGDKNVSKRKAQQLFPELYITHKTADAILIAYCGMLTGAGLSLV